MPLPPVGNSFRVFPSQGSWFASRRHQLPGRSPPACLNAPLVAYPPVSPTTTLARSSLDPPWARAHFPPTRRCASRLPGPGATEPFRSASFVDFEALLPLRIRSDDHGCFTANAGPYSPGLCPSRARPLAPQVLLPAQALRPEHGAPTRSWIAPRPQGPCDPSSRVKPHRTPKRTTRLARQFPAPFETGPHHLSAAPLLP